MMYRRVGDPTTEPELLRERSPLTHADKIRIPLLVVQGANDPRVKQAEAEQIVAALSEKGLPHEYLLFGDEARAGEAAEPGALLRARRGVPRGAPRGPGAGGATRWTRKGCTPVRVIVTGARGKVVVRRPPASRRAATTSWPATSAAGVRG